MKKFKMDVNSNALVWWETLSDLQRAHVRVHFDEVREWNKSRKYSQFPNMYDLTGLRNSQLSEKQITRIWVFKDFVIPT